MKIRLQITAADQSLTFDHGGPVIRVGRDPGCELHLQGKASDTVSRWHARIELAQGGATLADTQSSNGTLLNDQPIQQPVPLRLGDRIQMGHTGAQLTVLELDLIPTPVHRVASRFLLPIGGGLVLATALLAGVLWLALRSGRPSEGTPPPGTESRVEISTQGKPETSRVVPTEPAPSTSTPPSPPLVKETKPLPPNSETKAKPVLPETPETERPLGRYVVPKTWVSVLLQRRGQAYPWSVVLPGEEIYPDHTLVSLPGFQSLLELTGGVKLNLWGSLPDLAPGATVLESAVILHSPDKGFDATFTLDRGRVHLINGKEDGQTARVRVHFLRQTWDLELNPKAEAVLDLYGFPFWSLNRDPGRPEPRTFLDVLVKGPGRVQWAPQKWLPEKPLPLFRLHWEQPGGRTPSVQDLPGPPPWLSPSEKVPSDPQVQYARRSLFELEPSAGRHDRSRRTRSREEDVTVKDIIVNELQHAKDARDDDSQNVGLLFLASLDAIEPLVSYLKDQNSNLRRRDLSCSPVLAWPGSQSCGAVGAGVESPAGIIQPGQDDRPALALFSGPGGPRTSDLRETDPGPGGRSAPDPRPGVVATGPVRSGGLASPRGATNPL